MATLNIGGKKVTVGDEFLSLPADQQSAAVEEIAASLGSKPQAAPSETDALGNVTGGKINAYVPKGMSYDDQARMVANGMTFGLADKFAGGMNYLTGNAPSYDTGVKAERGRTQEIRDANPVAAGVGEAAGGMLSGAGLIKNGVTVAGRVGPGLLARVLGYGAEGAGYGAAHGAGNTYSDNAGDYVRNAGKGAEVGSAIGAGLPVLGAAAGATYRTGSAFLGPRVEGAGRGASALLRGAAQADEAGLRGLGTLGPEAMLPDAGPAMLGLAQGAGTGTGAGRSQLIGALENRDAGTARRLAQTLDRNFGQAPTPSRIEAGLSGDRAYAGQGYGPVMQQARATNTQGLANELDTAAVNLRGPAQRSVRDVRGMLDIPGAPGNLDPHPRALLSTRQAIDGQLATETNPQVIRELTVARQAVDAELARAAPGIKPVDAQIEELSRQSSGLQRGGQVLDSGKTAIRPSELVAEIQQGANPQGQMVGPSAVPFRMRQGARADIDRRVGTNINDLNQLEKTFGTPQDWNNQKLGTVFGEGPRDAVAGGITANRTFRDTYQKVAQNSQTAQRTEAAKAMEGAAGGNIPTDITATSIGLKAVNGIAKILSGQSNATTRDEVGRLLASRGVDAQRLVRALLDSAQVTNTNARSIVDLLSSPRWISASAPAAGRR